MGDPNLTRDYQFTPKIRLELPNSLLRIRHEQQQLQQQQQNNEKENQETEIKYKIK